MAKKNKPQNTISLNLKKFWNFIWHDDSLLAYLANFAVAIILIKFVLFPVLGFFLGTDFPIVAIVSGSMEHKIVDSKLCGNTYSQDASLNFDQWWDYCGDFYESNYKITKEEFEKYPFKSGLNIGDVMILRGKDASEIEVGEVLVFVPGDLEWYANHGPVIHRVVDKFEENGELFFTTKGDHNSGVATLNNFEEKISQNQILAVGSLRIPYLGYPKKLLNDLWFLIRGNA